ncbi:MAG: DUF5682 family protein [Polyangiaceae bacterium]
MAELCIVGVRHHSPACARLVARVIDERAPATVLIEGPSDMNERLDELLLPHALPVAVYSYRLDGSDAAQARGTWTPLCDYSPEWVALSRGRAAGAETLFIDLPAWDDAFHGLVNRYADGVLTRLSWTELCARHGFDCSDALWDHLFEARDDDGLEARLGEYFDALRGSGETEDVASEMDARREAFMARFIAWTLGRLPEDATVLVVCGGYHAPALRRLVAEILENGVPPEPPAVEAPADARVGSFLVPFSFKRLDSFAGYASGMPSPAFYQAVWERDAGAPEHMLGSAIRRLRDIGQVISAADHAAAATMCQGLARMRGHAVPTRVDTLDGLVAALLKEPIDGPLPWSERGLLRPGTSPLLVELVATYSGDRHGRLAPDTPAPPLVEDTHRALDAAGLSLTREPKRVRLASADPATANARAILHRLRILAIEGVELVAMPSLARSAAKEGFAERWALSELDGTLPSLIERAVYGATLSQAARARLEERVAQADDLLSFVVTLQDALLAALPQLATSLSGAALRVVEKESRLAHAGSALDALRAIQRQLAADDPAVDLSLLSTAVFERALWLLEGAGDAADADFRREDLQAVRAIARAMPPEGSPLAAAAEECLERIALRRAAAPGLRGACLGALWNCHALAGRPPAAIAGEVCVNIESDRLGDFLSGLVITAREELLASALLDAVDDRVVELEEEEFLIALPALRRAFSFFPPQERLAIARRVLDRRGVVADTGTLLQPVLLDEHAAAVETAVMDLIARYGLASEEEP